MKDVTILTNNGVNVQQSLELFGDMEMYDETLNDFLNMHQGKLANLERFRAMNDMANYAIEVHALKSDARYLGFMNLGDMAYESEMKSKAGDSAFVNANHPRILAEAKRVINLAETYLGRPLTVVFPGLTPSVQTIPVAPVQSAQVVPQMQTVTPPSVNPGVQMQNVVPQPQAQMQGQTPIVQTSASGTIEFFPSNNNNIMDQGLSNINMPAQTVAPGTVPVMKEGIILVIDDSNLVANFVKKIFSDKYEVMVANDGAQGIQIANDPNIRPKIKTCLVDLYMPNVDGFAVLENFKQNGIFVKTPVAIISGAEDAASIERARSYPIIEVLAKPFTDRDVKMVVEKCLAVYF